VADRRLVVLALECGAAGKHQHLVVVRIELERAIEQFGRLTCQRTPVPERQRFGQVREQIRIAGVEHHRLSECIGRFLEALQRPVRAAEHHPAFGVVRFLAHTRRQFFGHLLETFGGHGRHIAWRVLRDLQALQTAKLEIQQHGGHRNQHADRDRRGAPPTRDRHAFGGSRRFLEHAAIEVGFRLLELFGAQHARFEIVFEFGQLVAIDFEIRFIARDPCSGPALEQRPQYDRDGKQQKNGGADDEGCHRVWPSRRVCSSASARARCSGVSSLSVRRLRRRRR